jgi:tetratricopeptide (TPR) repeat protein
MVVLRTAVRTSLADVLVGVGRACEARRDYVCAAAVFDGALENDAGSARSLTGSARALAAQAESATSVDERNRHFAEAARRLAEASSADPFDYHHPRNEGSIERRWARRLPANDRAPHLAKADRAYAEALARAPAAAPIWVEWANVSVEQRRVNEALDKLERAAALGRTSDTTIVCDALLPAVGVDVHEARGLHAAETALRARGLPHLADIYASRATGGSLAR